MEECSVLIETTKSANLYARIEPDVKEKAEFNEELEKGYVDMQTGRTKNAKKAFADIRKDYGL